MKFNNYLKKDQKGQAMPLLVFAIIALITMVALMIDGGMVMVNRRGAQAAADAGAMAGARELCMSTGADPLVVAETYALNNGAATANATLDTGLITVNTSVENSSFFAGVFGEDTLVAGAEAVAGCFAPDGNYVMPIAWSCRPSLVSEEPFDPDLDCKMMALDWADLLKPLVEGDVTTIEIPDNDGYFEMDGDDIVHVDTRRPAKQVYLIMDKISTTEETLCKEDLDPSDPAYPVAITCDLDADGKNDIEGGGNRGWLDLDNGGGGASSMVDWIVNGLDYPIAEHTWLSGQTGTVSSVYEAIKDYRQGDVVLIPVFNSICADTEPLLNSACMADAHASPKPPVPSSGDIDFPGSEPKFHVITFNPFYISCVHTFSFDYCPGFDLAQEVNPDPSNPSKSLIADNIPSVEGYFLTNMDVPLDIDNQCNVNLGNCTVSLTK